MRIVAVSDTHGHEPELPPGDVLVHCGDSCNRGTVAELERFGRWLGSLPFGHVVLTWGNHDRYAESHPEDAKRLIRAFCPQATVLLGSSVEIEGRAFYGGPWVPPFGDWAFMTHNPPWQIPADADVIVSHGPPYGYRDTVSDRPVGCPVFREQLRGTRARYVFCGHIHEGYGSEALLGTETEIVNVSSCDERYRCVNPPVVREL